MRGIYHVKIKNRYGKCKEFTKDIRNGSHLGRYKRLMAYNGHEILSIFKLQDDE
jgi:hypothetical protein